jgi:hypothetical protein
MQSFETFRNLHPIIQELKSGIYKKKIKMLVKCFSKLMTNSTSQRNQPISKEPSGEAVPTKNIRKRNISTFLKDSNPNT